MLYYIIMQPKFPLLDQSPCCSIIALLYIVFTRLLEYINYYYYYYCSSCRVREFVLKQVGDYLCLFSLIFLYFSTLVMCLSLVCPKTGWRLFVLVLFIFLYLFYFFLFFL